MMQNRHLHGIALHCCPLQYPLPLAAAADACRCRCRLPPAAHAVMPSSAIGAAGASGDRIATPVSAHGSPSGAAVGVAASTSTHARMATALAQPAASVLGLQRRCQIAFRAAPAPLRCGGWRWGLPSCSQFACRAAHRR